MYGTNPEVIVPTEDAEAAMQAQAKQQQMAQVGAAMPEMAGAAKTLSETDPAALGDVMNRFSGYGTPAPAQVN